MAEAGQEVPSKLPPANSTRHATRRCSAIYEVHILSCRLVPRGRITAADTVNSSLLKHELGHHSADSTIKNWDNRCMWDKRSYGTGTNADNWDDSEQ